jgi:hypothetical protein
MCRGLLAAVFLAAGAPVLAEPPPELIEATEEAAGLCTAAGGEPAILDGYEQSLDLNGDGVEDFVTDLARLECGGAWSAFCGSSGCPVTVWLSTAGGGHGRFELGRLEGFEIRPGDPLPEFVAHYATLFCGEAAEAGCSRTWVFETNAPDMPPTDGARAAEATPAPEPAAAEPAAEPVAAGWSLRHVPGSSPVALGGGVGEIASLAGFCLAGQPFLAVTLREPPEAERIRLAFDFSQGELAAEATYEATAGGAFVVALAETALAARLGGRDSEVAVSVDGAPQGILSLSGSTRALRGALSDCHGF